MRVFRSSTFREKIGCGNLYVTVGYTGEDKVDFIRIQTAGTRDNDCGCSSMEAIADLVTFSLKRMSEGDDKRIIKALKGHLCNKKVAGTAWSCSDALANVLKKVLYEKEEAEV